MKRIIVEGMDSTGKSTLIKSLMAEFHTLTGPVVNELGPAQEFDVWWEAQLMDKWNDHMVPIHDRFFYSELIYGEVLRGYVKASGPVVRRVERRLREEAYLIYCRPSFQTMEKTFDNKPQMEGVASRFSRLTKEYDRLMTQEYQYYGSRFTSYNYESEDLRLIKARVERYLFGELR